MKGDLLKNQLGPRDEKLSSKHQVFRISYHISDSLERSWSSTSIIWYVCWSWSSSSASGVSETFDIPTAVLKSVPSNHTLEWYWYAVNYPTYIIHKYVYIYMGSGRFPGPMELLLQQLVRVSKTRWRWFNLSKSMLLQPLIKKLEVLVMINQWTTYCINDNNDERWMVVLIDFTWLFVKINKSCLIKC